MKITTKGHYAVQAVLDLAMLAPPGAGLHPKGRSGVGGRGAVTLATISGRSGISLQYLEQLFVKLRKAGLVKSVRGPGGGYLLARNPGDISVGDIFRAVDENIFPTECSAPAGLFAAHSGGTQKNQPPCEKDKHCATQLIWQKLARSIRGVLDTTTIGEILRDEQNLRPMAKTFVR